MKKCKYKDDIELIFLSLNVKPEREYQFHPTREWRLDWAFLDRMLAVEYEGMPFRGKSRHTTIGGFSGDCEKYNELALAGWTLLRFNAIHVKSGLAHDQIVRAIEALEANPGIEKVLNLISKTGGH